jgi:SPP1 gp7 family putative phage head morphogenesis protein
MLPKKVVVKERLAKRHAANIAAFFKEQKATVMQALSGKMLGRSHPGMTRELETKGIPPDTWDRIWKSVVKKSTPMLKDVIASMEADGLHAGANGMRDALEGSISATLDKKTTFNLANPRAVAWFHEHGGSVDYIAGIQENTGNRIKEIITEGLKNGQAYSQTAKQISDEFDGFSRVRATRIAVYETAQAYEQGNMLLAQSLKDDGIEMEKMYQTSEDDLVSDLCRGNQDDGWIPLDEYHSSGVQEPPGHVNCRCFEMYRQRGQE